MTPDDVIRALEDGSIYRRKPDEWREMLRVAAQARASNPNYAHRMTQSEIIRHLLASHEQAAVASEARQQHESSYGLGRRTLYWTIVAAVAAIIAAFAALWPLLAPFFHH
jgi:hypothetical protein